MRLLKALLVRSAMTRMNLYFTTSLRPLNPRLYYGLRRALHSLTLRRRESYLSILRVVTLSPCYTLRYIADSHQLSLVGPSIP